MDLRIVLVDYLTKIQRNRRFRIYLSKPKPKTCFQHNMVYGDFKDLTRGTASEKVLRDKAFYIAENSKYVR